MKYKLIMICPPWRLYRRFKRSKMLLTDQIPTKVLAAMNAFDFIKGCLMDLAATEPIAVVWVPAKFTEDCHEYMKAMEYQYWKFQVWKRPKWRRGSSGEVFEYLMFYYKGRIIRPEVVLPNALQAPFINSVKSRHHKPDDAYTLLESLFPYEKSYRSMAAAVVKVGIILVTINQIIMQTQRLLLVFTFILWGFAKAHAQQSQLDIPALHQLVSQSESENKLQVDAKNQQILNTANEQANLTLLQKYKNLMRSIQQRFNTLGTAISVAEIGLDAAPMVSRIVSNQEQIIQLARKNPALVALGYEFELQFAGQAKDLLAYVTGLVLAYGDVNQMKASDRKILFDFELSELSHVEDLSGNMLSMMQYSSTASLLKAANPFQNWVNADIGIGTQIIQNAKYLK